MINILIGKISFVGAPLRFEKQEKSQFNYKMGLTGLVQINVERIQNEQSKENFELHYLKNQNLFMDVEILLQALFKWIKSSH
jgi:lipopolysaccharide/colanic/teichoic acid biosynthesis glycosyltransferase